MTTISNAPANAPAASVLLAGGPVPADLLTDVAAHAAALDAGTESSRRSFEALGAAGLLALGAPRNADGRLVEQVRATAQLAGECVSTAFSLWAHRMVVEYLLTAGTDWANATAARLVAGQELGVTAMAPAQKDATGTGSIELTARPEGSGWVVDGPIRWATNLHPDSVMVTAAVTPDGGRIVVALPLDAPGVTVGKHFDLLALGSTASSSVTLDGVVVPAEQVLATELKPFLGLVRPTFAAIQAALALGLARRSLDEARAGLRGITEVFRADVDETDVRLRVAEQALLDLAGSIGTSAQAGKRELLTLRLDASELATAAAGLELRVAGGRAFVRTSPTNRRYREAAFLPVQSPSEGQLRWELAAL